MRFILQDDVFDNLPANWDHLVATAQAYVAKKVAEAEVKAANEGLTGSAAASASLEARHLAIKAKASVWSAAGAALRKASNEKCWYCESIEDRSDKPVDHFRPKGSVIEDSSHPGYHWLAFDWRNFRLSCTYCNSLRRDVERGASGGKQDHFPITPPPPYARSAADQLDRPKLLDPVNDDDTKLLTFLANGYPHPANDNPETIDRVNTSIELYHLKQSSLVRKRKRLAADIQEGVGWADEARDRGDDLNYRFHKKEIIKKVRAQAELSSAARVYLRGFRDRPWVDEILNRDL